MDMKYQKPIFILSYEEQRVESTPGDRSDPSSFNELRQLDMLCLGLQDSPLQFLGLGMLRAKG